MKKSWRLKYSELVRDTFLTRLCINLVVVMSVLFVVMVVEGACVCLCRSVLLKTIHRMPLYRVALVSK